MRVIIPPTGNETISMLKTSSLASIATVGELFYIQEEISNANFDIIELLIVASIWYLRHDFDTHVRPVLPRTIFRAGFGSSTPADSVAAIPPDALPLPRSSPEPVDPSPIVSAASGGMRVIATPMVRAENVHKCYRAPRGAPRHRPRGRTTRGPLHRRPVGIRQEHLPPLHQPPREDRRRPALRGRRAGRLPGARRQDL